MNTAIDSNYLIAAIVTISLALVFYTFGVWGERFQKGLKLWHVVAFMLGVTCDVTGTVLMIHIAKVTSASNEIHTITGFIAIVLMSVNAFWALWAYSKGSQKARKQFSRFSIFVWLLWLIPYFIGMCMGMAH
ncbi:MAG: HsmA family protein [Rikenellaceae bacterium]